MKDNEWLEFLNRFIQVFGVKASDEIGMLAAWREIFEKLEYTPEELRDATTWATSQEVRRFKDYVRLIQSRINSERLRIRREQMNLRQQEAFAEEEKQMPFHGCEHCRNQKWVIVPHPRCIDGSKWVSPWIEWAVICDKCEKGRQWKAGIEEKKTSGGMPLSLSRYEEDFPDWRQMVEAAKSVRELQREALQSADRADDRRNPNAKPQDFSKGIGNMPKQAQRPPIMPNGGKGVNQPTKRF